MSHSLVREHGELMGLPHRRTVRVNPETDEGVQRIGKEFPPEEALESFARSTS